jgi:hypothetical protein
MGRRELLLFAGIVGVGASVGCKKSDPVSCAAVGQLSPEEQASRDTLQYVDIAPTRDRTCQQCRQWLPQEEGGCGACKVMKGPVHPKGTCRLFAGG